MQSQGNINDKDLNTSKNYNPNQKFIFNLKSSLTLLCDRSQILIYRIIVPKDFIWVN